MVSYTTSTIGMTPEKKLMLLCSVKKSKLLGSVTSQCILPRMFRTGRAFFLRTDHPSLVTLKWPGKVTVVSGVGPREAVWGFREELGLKCRTKWGLTGPCRQWAFRMDRGEQEWPTDANASLRVSKAVRSIFPQPNSASCTRLTACLRRFPAVTYTRSIKSCGGWLSPVRPRIPLLAHWIANKNCFMSILVIGGSVDNRAVRRRRSWS